MTPLRKILMTATAAALALGLSACNINASGSDDKTAAGPTSAGPDGGTASPTKTAAPGGHHSGAPSHGSGGTGGAGGNSASGKLSYMAPGKFMVGNTAFFIATDTVVIVDGGKCPDDAARPNNRCTTDNMEMWVKSAPRFAKVSFSGQIATVIREISG